MAHTAPTPVPGSRSEARKDARNRGWRTLAQGGAVAALVGAALAVANLFDGADTIPSLAVLGTAAATGATTAVAAWAQRRIEDYRNRRGGDDQ